MRALLLLMVFLASGATFAIAEDADVDALQRDNLLLQAEYELARNGKPYLVIDLQDGVLLYRVSGLSLDTWPIAGYRSWGRPALLSAAGLERKIALDEPERDVQIVNIANPADKADESKTEESKTEESKGLKAFELSDMPDAYRLRLANGTDITVRPAPSGWFSGLRRALGVPAWYLTRPLISNWNFLRGSPYNELALTLSGQDARKLYWAFNEGMPCLIRFPAEGVAPTQTSTEKTR